MRGTSVADDDGDRFDALFDAHYGAVLGYAARRCDLDTAQEIASETFLVAWRPPRRSPAGPCAPVAARRRPEHPREPDPERVSAAGRETDAAWWRDLDRERSVDPAEAAGDRSTSSPHSRRCPPPTGRR